MQIKLRMMKNMANSIELNIRITGMRCAACAAGIEKGLSRTKGVYLAEVNFATSTARVDYDPQLIGEALVFERISKLGDT